VLSAARGRSCDRAATPAPLCEAAVDDGARVVATGAKDAGGDRCSGAALADRHHGAVCGEIGISVSHDPIGDVAAAGNEPRLALVGLAHVDHRDAVGDELL